MFSNQLSIPFYDPSHHSCQIPDYSCTYWRGRKPHQGKLYLSVNYLCFYSYLVGAQMKLKLRWTEITRLEANTTNILLPHGFTVVTRGDGEQGGNHSHDFSLLMNFADAYRHASQLVNLAMRQMIEEEGFAEDALLRSKYELECGRRRIRGVRSNVSFVKRDLDARQRSEAFRWAQANKLLVKNAPVLHLNQDTKACAARENKKIL